MGNITQIRDKNGNEIARLDLNLADLSYAQTIVNKYYPGERIISRNIDALLKRIYEVAKPEDCLALQIIMHDKSDFNKSNLPMLKYLSRTSSNQRISKIAGDYVRYILKHGEIQTEFIGVDMGHGMVASQELKTLFG